MKTIEFTNEQLQQLEVYLTWIANESTNAKEDLKNIETLLAKLK